jgi:hypothetical protein
LSWFLDDDQLPQWIHADEVSPFNEDFVGTLAWDEESSKLAFGTQFQYHDNAVRIRGLTLQLARWFRQAVFAAGGFVDTGEY